MLGATLPSHSELSSCVFARNFSHCAQLTERLKESTRRPAKKDKELRVSDSNGQFRSLAGVERAGSHGSCRLYVGIFVLMNSTARFYCW